MSAARANTPRSPCRTPRSESSAPLAASARSAGIASSNSGGSPGLGTGVNCCDAAARGSVSCSGISAGTVQCWAPASPGSGNKAEASRAIRMSRVLWFRRDHRPLRRERRYRRPPALAPGMTCWALAWLEAGHLRRERSTADRRVRRDLRPGVQRRAVRNPPRPRPTEGITGSPQRSDGRCRLIILWVCQRGGPEGGFGRAKRSVLFRRQRRRRPPRANADRKSRRSIANTRRAGWHRSREPNAATPALGRGRSGAVPLTGR
ncbi:MAG: hypothetical protein AVDCRST_MAG08-1217 [uncultured Acetobacteraceae bacterium]|uniref:Uncharacterized protein n=1 Tax=uncultured Acetobacteraceae bacterium TaxID=169975 RepID=A0A6J4HTA9_9PROT|nr:MAG: hypothetical protein AVDCRST_MAG08-1217 [uncultured Acetobacteraceae bacterium]